VGRWPSVDVSPDGRTLIFDERLEERLPGREGTRPSIESVPRISGVAGACAAMTREPRRDGRLAAPSGSIFRSAASLRYRCP
jgi:hypothetical protein